MKPVVLLQTPFFKAAGSHNNRVGLELCYASRYLEQAGIDHVVLNADYEQTTVYHPWRVLFENHEQFRAACDGKSPVIDQCVEQVMQFAPKVVVVAAGDNYIPTKNFGSPYIAFWIAHKLKKYAKVIGVGPQFTRDSEPFKEAFDEFFTGPVEQSLVDAVLGRPRRQTEDLQDILPQFRYTHPPGQTTDYVMSAFGCPFRCNFCYTPIVWKKMYWRRPEDFVRDVHTRALLTGESLYISDMHFPARVKHVRAIADLLMRFPYRFTCESRLKKLTTEEAWLLKQIGVRTIKLGVEALDNKVLRAMNKRQTVAQIRKAVESFKKAGFKLVGYLLFGSYYDGNVVAMEKTIAEAESMTEIDYWVVNVASFINVDWRYRYDSHFSVIAAEQQGVPENILFRALDVLQEKRKNPTVATI